MKIKSVFGSVMGVVGGVIGLVIVADVVSQETYDPALNETGSFEQGTLEATTVNYLVPLLALGLLASAVTAYKFA